MTKDEQLKDLLEKLTELDLENLNESDRSSKLRALRYHPVYDIKNLVENPKSRIDMIDNLTIEYGIFARQNDESI